MAAVTEDQYTCGGKKHGFDKRQGKTALCGAGKERFLFFVALIQSVACLETGKNMKRGELVLAAFECVCECFS